MAKLKNLDSIWTAPEGHAVKVGNNRTITRDKRDGGAIVFTCRLHGAPVVKVTPHGDNGTATVRLDACGYLTTTTIAAMGDFIAAFGIRGRASRAGGILSARWYLDGWFERESLDGESMAFTAHRHPATVDA